MMSSRRDSTEAFFPGMGMFSDSDGMRSPTPPRSRLGEAHAFVEAARADGDDLAVLFVLRGRADGEQPTADVVGPRKRLYPDPDCERSEREWHGVPPGNDLRPRR